MSEKIGRKPVYVVRLKGVKGSVFENPSGEGPFYKATYCKVYRDRTSGVWKTTQSFSDHDHPILKEVIDRLWRWMLEAGSQDTVSSIDDERKSS